MPLIITGIIVSIACVPDLGVPYFPARITDTGKKNRVDKRQYED
jgi:hypothetical protein